MVRGKVFISSTQEDLQPEYETVRRVANELGFDVMSAETYPRRRASPKERIIQRMKECHIYIGIFGNPVIDEMEKFALDAVHPYILLYCSEAIPPVFLDNLIASQKTCYRRFFTNTDDLGQQVKKDLQDCRTLAVDPEIMVVEDNGDDRARLKEDLEVRLQKKAPVQTFDNGKAAVEFVNDTRLKPHFAIIDSMIPWSHTGRRNVADHRWGIETAKRIDDIGHCENCGGIYLLGYSSLGGDGVPREFKDVMKGPVYEKVFLDQLVTWLMQDHVNDFIKGYVERIGWIEEIMCEFAQIYGERMKRPFSPGASDFIGRLVNLNRSLLRQHLFEVWSQWPKGVSIAYDVDSLRLRELRAVRIVAPNTQGGKMDIEELTRLQARADALGSRLRELDDQHNAGMLQTPDWVRMKTTLDSERRLILSQIQEMLQGTEAGALNPAIGKAAQDAPENEVRSELKTVAERKGWGKTILDKIEDYRGEIVGLIVSIAIEVLKHLSTS